MELSNFVGILKVTTGNSKGVWPEKLKKRQKEEQVIWEKNLFQNRHQGGGGRIKTYFDH